MFTQNNSFQQHVFEPDNPTANPPQPGQAELEPYVPVQINPWTPWYLIQTAKIGIAAILAAPPVVNNPPPNRDQLDNLAGIISAWQPDYSILPQLPRNLNPSITAVPVNNPIPNRDQLDNLAEILAAWNPEPVHQYIHRAGQPYDYIKLVQPFIPPSTHIAFSQGWLSTVLSAWQPPDPQPILPRNLNPSITAVPVNNPPFNQRPLPPYPITDFILPQTAPQFPQQFVATAQTPYAKYWLDAVLSAWQPQDPLPTLPRNLPPSITAVRVDNPPFTNQFNVVVLPDPPLPQTSPRFPQQFVATVQTPYANIWQVTVLNAWQPQDPLPILPKLLPPQVRVDNPPFNQRPLPPYPVVDFILPQTAPQFPQAFVAPSVIIPYANAWQVTVLNAWQPPDPLPTLPKQNSPGIPGMSADPPPPGIWDLGPVIPGQVFPWVPFYLRQGKRGSIASGPIPIPPEVDNPTPNGDQIDNLAAIVAAWNPEPVHYFIHKALQPFDYAKLPPQILNVPVNDPPFNSRTAIPGIIDLWQPDQRGLPQTLTNIVQGILPHKDVPFLDLRYLTTILNTWIQPDPLPTLPKQNSPGIPGMSVDNPPGFLAIEPFEIEEILPQPIQVKIPQQFTAVVTNPYANYWMATVLSAWNPEPVHNYIHRAGQPYDWQKLNPAITAVPVNNPPFTQRERIEDQYRIITYSWQPPDPLPTLPVKFNFGVRVDNPPFSGRDLLSNILITWQPPDPQYIHRAGQPYDYLKINPGIPGVSVDNPPFIHPARTVPLNEIIQNAWMPPDPLPTLNIKFTAGTRFDNPPFTYGGRTVQYAQIIYNTWIPPDPLPTLNVKLPPALAAVRVDNPPFTSRTQLPNILLYWQPPDPLPTRSVTLKVVISGSAAPKHVFEWLQRARRRGRR